MAEMTKRKLNWIERKLSSAIEAALEEGFYLTTGTMRDMKHRGVGVCAQGALVRHDESTSSFSLDRKVREILKIGVSEQNNLMSGFDFDTIISFLNRSITEQGLFDIGQRLREKYFKIDGKDPS